MNLSRLILEYEKLLKECDFSCEKREELKRDLLRLKLQLYDNRVSASYEKKVAFSNKLVRKIIKEYGDISAVACSFGKDSLVVLHLVIQYKPDVRVIYNNTHVEYPETKEFKEKVKKLWGLNLVETEPDKSFWQVVKEYGYPDMRYSHGTPRCCYWMKVRPTKRLIQRENIRVLFFGLTGSESYQRKWTIVNYRPIYKTKRNAPYEILKVHPIAYWKEEDVWRYIRENGIPVHPAYSYTNRIGCLPCTAHKGWMVRLARVNPKLLRRILRDRVRMREGVNRKSDFVNRKMLTVLTESGKKYNEEVENGGDL